MREILNFLYSNKSLNRTEAKEVLTKMAEGKYNNSQIASFLSVYIMRNITVDELSGFRDALLNLCIPVDLSAYNTIDMCGTGGDGKDTFNISTLSSFILAAMGEKVSKHGNYAVSSNCGSSNILETIGYKFSTDAKKLQHEMEVANICYLHAPLFNPAMKNVAPVRKELGVKTFFNMLGPMVNPTNPQNQLVGVYDLDLARLYTYIYQQSEKNFCIVHSLDGYDEVSLTAAFKMITNRSEKIIKPDELNLPKLQHNDLKSGGSVEESVKMFVSILQGKGTNAQNKVVAINSALGLHCLHPEKSLSDCIDSTYDTILSGKGFKVMEKLISIQ